VQVSDDELLKETKLNPSTTDDLVNILSNMSIQHHSLLNNSFEESFNVQFVDFYSTAINLPNVTIIILRNFNGPPRAIVNILPGQILPDDGILYRKDHSDPEFNLTVTPFFRASQLIHVQAREHGADTILVLQFHSTDVANYTCAKWDSNFNAGAWVVNDCYYLGRHNGSEMCQCHSMGMFSLFRYGDILIPGDSDDKIAIYVAAAIFWLATFLICFRFYLILPKEKCSKSLSFEFCRIENRILLQLLIAWCLFLMSYIVEPLTFGPSVACVILSTFWQYFLFVSMAWVFILLAYHRRQLLDQLIINPTTFLIKISFFTW
jgi:hypothetical protein